MATTTLYMRGRQSLIVAGKKITGLGDDNTIEYKQDGGNVVKTYGADQSYFSLNPTYGATYSINILITSSEYGYLLNLQKLQNLAADTFSVGYGGITITYIDPTGVKYDFIESYFDEQPSNSLGGERISNVKMSLTSRLFTISPVSIN